jgi:hypothetical protein
MASIVVSKQSAVVTHYFGDREFSVGQLFSIAAKTVKHSACIHIIAEWHSGSVKCDEQ